MPVREVISKSGTVSYRVYFVYKDKYGVKHNYSRSGFKNMNEARKHEREIGYQISQGKILSTECKKTLNQVFLEYMDLVGKHKYAPDTYITYMIKFNTHVKNTDIGNSRISALRYKEIQKFFNSLDYNSRALNLDIKKIFCTAFNYAIKNEYVEKSPMQYIEVIGRVSDKKIHIISLEELNQLADMLCEYKEQRDMQAFYSYSIALYIGYYLGLRISETLALKKSDFDFVNNVVSINKRIESHDTAKGLYSTDRLKTAKSKAILPVCEPLKQVLLEWFDCNPYELVCCRKNGSYIDYRAFDRAVNNQAQKLGFNFHSHQLRHTFSTNLCRSGVPVKIASELARHSDITTTLNIYVHTCQKEKEDAISQAFNAGSRRNAKGVRFAKR